MNFMWESEIHENSNTVIF